MPSGLFGACSARFFVFDITWNCVFSTCDIPVRLSVFHKWSILIITMEVEALIVHFNCEQVFTLSYNIYNKLVVYFKQVFILRFRFRYCKCLICLMFLRIIVQVRILFKYKCIKSETILITLRSNEKEKKASGK